jgi:hypothetical protein
MVMAGKAELPQPICGRCGRRPDEIEEYIEAAKECDDDAITPDVYVRSEEGTYNKDNGHFLCTTCYVEAGMPTSDRGWVCP